MPKRTPRALRPFPPRVLGALFVLLVAIQAAPALTIKLGSLMPPGSPWDVSLRRLAADWQALSGGSVRVTVYAGGTVGDEEDMIRKMRINQLQAAGLTIKGLNKIVSGVLAVAAPLLYRNDEELEYAFERLRPLLEERVLAQGYVPIIWTNVGWVQFLATRPVIVPDDLRRLRMWIWQGDADEELAWRTAGFLPVARPATEIMIGLQSGAVEALAANPVVAAAYQWFAFAPELSDLLWAPFLGVVVVRSEVWRQVPVDLRSVLMARAREAEEEMAAAMVQANEKALAVMRANGLRVHHVPDSAVPDWEAVWAHGLGALLGTTFDPELYELARRYVAEYRASSPPR